MLYHLEETSETGAGLRAILREMKIPALTVDETHLTQRVGTLVSSNASARSAAPPSAPEAEFLLLSALGDRQLDRLLTAMRRSGVSVAHKAVLTERNRDWTLLALMEEIAREHAAFANRNG